MLWASHKVLETATEAINYTERKKNEERGPRCKLWGQRKTSCNY